MLSYQIFFVYLRKGNNPLTMVELIVIIFVIAVLSGIKSPTSSRKGRYGRSGKVKLPPAIRKAMGKNR